MPYRSGAIFLIIASAVALVIGLYRAAKARRWVLFAGTAVFVAGYPILIAAIFQIADRHLGLWVLLAVLMFFPAWIMAGVAVYGMTHRSPDQWFGVGAKPPSAKIRYRGLVALVIGLIAWCVGALNPELSNNVQLPLLAIAGYGLLFGCFWIIGGRRL
jgi:hypothetical protein